MGFDQGDFELDVDDNDLVEQIREIADEADNSKWCYIPCSCRIAKGCFCGSCCEHEDLDPIYPDHQIVCIGCKELLENGERVVPLEASYECIECHPERP